MLIARLWAVLAAVEGGAFGGPGAIATTPVDFGTSEVAVAPVAAVEPVDFGDSESAWLLPDVGVVAGVCANEFFRDDFFRVAAELTGPLPVPRLRFLITSVLSESGRTTPCSLRNKPHALHSGCPSGLRLHNGVVCVKQLVQVVGALPGSPGLVPPGL